MQDAAYVANGPDRCARCKTALMDALGPLADAEGATVVLGVNVSDLGDHRPGQAAAAAAGAAVPSRRGRVHQGRHPPLVARARPAHLGQAGRRLPGLAPALRHAGDARPSGRGRAGRGRVARARVRAAPGAPPRRGGSARGGGRRRWTRWWRAATRSSRLCAAAGFTFVALDLEGFRSGSLNRVLRGAGGESP